MWGDDKTCSAIERRNCSEAVCAASEGLACSPLGVWERLKTAAFC